MILCVCEISRQCRRGYHGLFFASSKSVYFYRCFFFNGHEVCKAIEWVTFVCIKRARRR